MLLKYWQNFKQKNEITELCKGVFLCRSRREPSNAYFVAKFGLDTAENEPCRVCPINELLGAVLAEDLDLPPETVDCKNNFRSGQRRFAAHKRRRMFCPATGRSAAACKHIQGPPITSDRATFASVQMAVATPSTQQTQRPSETSSSRSTTTGQHGGS